MKRSVISIAALWVGIVAPLAAHAAYGIGTSGGLTWEQVRFYGPAGAADATYSGGQPIYLGTVGTDYCAGADRCGEPMTFDTLAGGTLTATAIDDANGMVNTTNGIAYQDLTPSYGGLGVVSLGANNAITGGDEINKGDKLTLSFANQVRVIGLYFFDRNHGTSDLNWGDTYGLAVGSGATQVRALSSAFFDAGSTLIGNKFTFSYTNEDYYLGAIGITTAELQSTVPAIPEPQTYALLLAGLGAVGFMARRRRTPV